MNKEEFEMINDAMNAIEITETKEFVKNWKGSFMTCMDERKYSILNKIKYQGHSGCSIMQTLQNCKYYLKKEEEWKQIIKDFS